MADANSNTSFSVNDLDTIERCLREIEATSWLMCVSDESIPTEHMGTIGYRIETHAQTVASLVERLWDAYKETSNHLTVATKLVSMAAKAEGASHE